MKKKFCTKEVILFVGVFVVLALGIVLLTIYGKSENRKYQIESTYNESVEYYNKGNYTYAYYGFQELPSEYKDSTKYLDIIKEYRNIYSQALSSLENENYEDAVAILKELPEGYSCRDELIKGMDKLKILIENEWEDIENGQGDSEYKSNFSLSVFPNTLDLYLYLNEDEYTLGNLINSYKDEIGIKDLLDDNSIKVESDDRDNFTLDISNVESGTYSLSTSYVKSTYETK